HQVHGTAREARTGGRAIRRRGTEDAARRRLHAARSRTPGRSDPAADARQDVGRQDRGHAEERPAAGAPGSARRAADARRRPADPRTAHRTRQEGRTAFFAAATHRRVTSGETSEWPTTSFLPVTSGSSTRFSRG